MIKNILKSFIVIGLISLSSCSKEKFFGNNEDPSVLQDPSLAPGVLLTPAELAIAYVQGGDLSRYDALFTNQVVGAYRQFAGYGSYTFSTDDFGNPWNSFYTTGFQNLTKLESISTSKGYNRYNGIAKILKVYLISMISDHWGDVPYSQASQLVDNLKPSYDTQEKIYTDCFKVLDEAITNLSNTDPGGIKPSSDDLIYKGDASKWIKFAHALKARLYLHLANVNNENVTKGLSELSSAFTSVSDDASFPFANSTNGNPWYQYVDQRADITYVGSQLFTDYMTDSNDTRIPLWVDATNDNIGEFWGDAGAPVYFITYAEQKFIEAELQARNGSNGNASSAYTAAVTASFKMAGLAGDEAAYLTNRPFTSSSNIDSMLIPIMTEKYIALFTLPEVYNDWRRTGYPSLTPLVSGKEIPRRYLYPTSEILYNGANVPSSNSLNGKVWWDQ